MQKWNIPTDRTQKVDEINGDICLVIMFTPGVMVIKISKLAHFYILYWCHQKNQSQFGENICIWKITFSSFRKCYGLLDSELPLARYQPLKIESFIIFLLIQQFSDISTLNISRTVTPRLFNHTIFWKNWKRSLRYT